MSSDITAGFTPAASPAAALTPKAAEAAAKRYSVATTKTYYGFNCRPRQVKSIACIRDAERVAEALDAGRLDPAIATAYAVRLSAALAKAEAVHAATRADYDACDKRRQQTSNGEVRELLRAKCATLWRRHDSADERRDDIAKAHDTVRAALARRAAKGGAL